MSDVQIEKIWKWLAMMIGLLGIGLRIYQYAMGRSLWEDEAHLALNFIYSGYQELFLPLAHFQAAPILFLLIIETITRIAGFGELALRFFPFIISIITLPLFYLLVRKLFKDQWFALSSFLLFAVNLSIINYSSELKPYAIDLAVWTVLMYLMFGSTLTRQKRMIWLLIVGSLAVFLSNTTPVVLMSIGFVLVGDWIKEKKVHSTEVRLLMVWMVSLLVNYFSFQYHHPYRAGMEAELSSGFLPIDIFSTEFDQFIRRCVEQIGSVWYLNTCTEFGFHYIVFILALIGIAKAVSGKYSLFRSVVLIPIGIHLLISALSLYPFQLRFIHYLIPSFMLLILLGLQIVTDLLERMRMTWLRPLMILVFIAFSAYPSVTGFPFWYREFGPIIHELNTRYPDRKIYVTTPYTLYKYYQLTGRIQDTNVVALPWNIGREAYFDLLSEQRQPYLLLHAAHDDVDGYSDVNLALKENRLISNSYLNKTYVLDEVQPLPEDTNAIVLDHNSVDNAHQFNLDGKNVISIWNGELKFTPFDLETGVYEMSILAKGTEAAGGMPIMQIGLNESQIGSYQLTGNYIYKRFTFEQKADAKVLLTFGLENDTTNGSQDRNIFIVKVMLKRKATLHTN